MGSKSLCTPSLLTSGPPFLEAPTAILSISSINTIPVFCAFSIASSFTSSISINFADSSSIKILRASAIDTFLFFTFFGIILPIMSCRFIIDTSSIAPPPIIPTPLPPGCFTLMSIFLSSSSPFRIFSLKRSRVFSLSSASFSGISSSAPEVTTTAFEGDFTGGISASKMISSTMASALAFTISFLLALINPTDCSTKSLIILSTSRPT